MIRPLAQATAERAQRTSIARGAGWLFVAGFGLYVGLFYPGFMSTDSVVQLLQARNGIYSDWHPPIMAYLWGTVERLTVPGPAGMLVLQAGLVWGGAYLSYTGWFGGSRGAAVGLFLLLLSPPILGIAGVIWKDILMWGFLFFAAGLVGHVGGGRSQTAAKRWLLSATASMALLLAICVRHNAVLAVIPIMALLVLRHFAYTNFARLVPALILGGVVGAGGFVLVGAISTKVSDVHSEAWVVLPVFDAAGVIARLHDEQARQRVFERIPDQMRRAENVQSLVRSYSARYWRTLFRGRAAPLVVPVAPDHERSQFWIKQGFSELSEGDLEELRRLWFSLPMDHPSEWLRHRLAVFAHVLGLTPDDLWGPAFMQTRGFPDWIRGYYTDSPASTALQKYMQDAIASLSDWWFFRPWFYFFAGAVIVVVLVAFFRPGFSPPLLIAGSGLLHELGLFIAAPSPDFRYSHYLAFSIALAFLLLIFSTRESTDHFTGYATSPNP